MALQLYSGGTGSTTSQNSVQKLYIRYTPTTPVEIQAGAVITLSNVMPATEKITVAFQSGSGGGTREIAVNVPLLLLAHIQGLENSSMVYMHTIESESVLYVQYVEFTVPIFEVCRQFGSGDQLQLSFVLAGGTVTVWNSDNPVQSRESKPIFYRQQTILGLNKQNLDSAFGVVYIPNVGDFKLQTQRNIMVQWTQQDFFASFADDWVTNFTPYQNADFLGIDISKFRNSELTAGAANLTFFYKQ